MWRPGRVPLLTRATPPTLVYRLGLVSEDELWGLHLDGEYIDLTHVKSGKRIGRFPSLGQAAEAATALGAMDDVSWVTTNVDGQLTESQLYDIGQILATHQVRHHG